MARKPEMGPDPDELPAEVDDHLELASARYSADAQPWEVSFRSMLPLLKYKERATHYLHPYPGKLLPHIPFLFLRARGYLKPGGRVLDPFCGSGTTLVEAYLRGASADGYDVNPFAALLSAVKVTPLQPRTLYDAAQRAAKRMGTAPAASRNIPNAALWYHKRTFSQLLKLRYCIERCRDLALRNALLVSFSALTRQCSFADPRIPVPVRVSVAKARTQMLEEEFRAVEARARDADIIPRFLAITAHLATRLATLPALREGARIEVSAKDFVADAVAPHRLHDLVITSPPYCAAQKYVRSTALAMSWIWDMGPTQLANLEASTIGREHIRRDQSSHQALQYSDVAATTFIDALRTRDPIRGRIATTYLNDMNKAVAQISRSIKRGGHLVMIIGDNSVGGAPFPATNFISRMIESHNMRVTLVMRDSIPSRGLMTKRNNLSGPISHEQIVIARKLSERGDHG